MALAFDLMDGGGLGNLVGATLILMLQCKMMNTCIHLIKCL